MKCISVRQPWARAIVAGHKTVENRSWSTEYRGPLLIHAGQIIDRAPWVAETFAAAGVEMPRDLELGKIIGAVDLMDVVRIGFEESGELVGVEGFEHSIAVDRLRGNPWAGGPWCWVLANPRAIEIAIPWPGRLGLFDVRDEDICDRAAREWMRKAIGI